MVNNIMSFYSEAFFIRGVVPTLARSNVGSAQQTMRFLLGGKCSEFSVTGVEGVDKGLFAMQDRGVIESLKFLIPYDAVGKNTRTL
ncbi:hypothetical protein [Tunturiibacter gelidiferens]|uniref:hypothetical protein n=1 Tax=Tunturiibacter gelidiferens TaxID=3069689 RepID=UPI003D9BD360